MTKLISILSTLLLTGCSLVGIRTSEEPQYQILQDYGNIQIRQYPTLLVAKTEINGDYKTSGNQGFKRLAGYIFGKNQSQQQISMTAPAIQEKQSAEHIAMTAPVIQQKSGDNWYMAFVLPSTYTLANAPIPLDPAIKLTEIPSKKLAVLSYTGRLSEQGIKEKSTELNTWLMQHNYTVLYPAQSAAYDPPWTLPFLRRNEIHIQIK
ncbi:MAG: heme-binding protein [Methylococcales bacterium]|nr:heme-binding protein [Methylococcales bacterium]